MFILIATAIIIIPFVLFRPLRGLYLFAFLIPFEEIAIIAESFTALKLIGWVIFAGWLINKLLKKESFKIPKGFQFGVLYVSWGALSNIWSDRI